MRFKRRTKGSSSDSDAKPLMRRRLSSKGLVRVINNLR
jgi:hypothetical protein